jgi:hypothetical protein
MAKPEARPPKALDDFELTLEADDSWTLRRYSDRTVQSRHSRLIDAIYERERLISGEVPPFGRWVLRGFLSVHPLFFDGESDELMQLDSTINKTLHLQDWEYRHLNHDFDASYKTSSSGDEYSDEFETKFHYAVQQRSVAPFMTDSDESRTAPIQRKQVDDEEGAPYATDSRPFYKRHPIIFWTLIGALLTALGNGYKKYQMNERIKAEQTSGR